MGSQLERGGIRIELGTWAWGGPPGAKFGQLQEALRSMELEVASLPAAKKIRPGPPPDPHRTVPGGRGPCSRSGRGRPAPILAPIHVQCLAGG